MHGLIAYYLHQQGEGVNKKALSFNISSNKQAYKVFDTAP